MLKAVHWWATLFWLAWSPPPFDLSLVTGNLYKRELISNVYLILRYVDKIGCRQSSFSWILVNSRSMTLWYVRGFSLSNTSIILYLTLNEIKIQSAAATFRTVSFPVMLAILEELKVRWKLTGRNEDFQHLWHQMNAAVSLVSERCFTEVGLMFLPYRNEVKCFYATKRNIETRI